MPLGKLRHEHGYSYVWDAGEEQTLIKGSTIAKCITENHLSEVRPKQWDAISIIVVQPDFSMPNILTISKSRLFKYKNGGIQIISILQHLK